MPRTPRILQAGDRALVVEYGDTIDAGVNARVRGLAALLDRAACAGILELVPTYRSLLIHFDPGVVTVPALERLVRDADASLPSVALPEPRVVEVPTRYGGDAGPDLADVAAHAGMGADEVVAIHAATDYLVFMMGFMPGFPYLGGLSARIATPRLGTPRTVVPAGSVGIAGAQTGIYPTESPGGWRLIGRTPLRLFDVERMPPALIQAGDRVRFVPITQPQYDAIAAQACVVRSAAAHAAGRPGITVVDGGLLTTVQDLGRHGSQRYGVPVAGAMDGWALRAANRLVGNADGLAGLEMTLAGPVLRFEADAVIALTGADLGARIDGRPIGLWQSCRIRARSLISFAGARAGIRAYLAVAGGIDVPLVLGSRSTFTRSALGGHQGRALCAGDRLSIGVASPEASRVSRRLPRDGVPARGRLHDLRVMPGPQDEAFTPEGLATFLSAIYTVTPQSDRVGCRLSGPSIAHRAGADIVSDGTANGAVQVTGDGVPIILMADRGTTGGYTKIATIISADLGRVAQAAPGDQVRFVRVDADAAVEAARGLEQALEAIAPVDARTAGVPDQVYDEDAAAALAGDAYVELAEAIGAVGVARAASGALVRAAMPGLVVDILVAEGDTVGSGQTLVSLEAMKMQNAVRAPRAGRVARVLVARGASVDAGTPLVEFDAAG